MLRELEEAVQRKFNVAADGAHTMSLTESHVDWEPRLHISQVWDSYGCKIIGIICNLFSFISTEILWNCPLCIYCIDRSAHDRL